MARGQLFRLSGLWDGAAQPLGASRGVRYTRCAFLYNGHALGVACERGEWRIDCFDASGLKRTVPTAARGRELLGEPLEV